VIIVLSGWRGHPPKTTQLRVRQRSQALIDEACLEVAQHIVRNFQGVTIRFGDCPTGVDDSFNRLFRDRQFKRQLDRRNIRPQRFVADWTLQPQGSGGPIRNRAMLDGDKENPLDLHEGIAHQLIALPEPGRPKEKSGTWDTVFAAMERLIPVHLVHLGERDTYRGAGLRRSRMPLITPQERLTYALEPSR
jgi:hypothetical protein